MPRDRWKFVFCFTRQSLGRYLAALLLCFSSSLTFSNVYAQEAIAPPHVDSIAPQPTVLRSSSVPLATALKTLGDLTLQGVTIEKALFAISASWRVNIVVGKDVEGNVSCIYKQAPLREVLDAILLANGYSYRAVGESLVVQRAQDVGSANPLFESAAISITHSDMDEILEGARLLLSKQGQIRALSSAKSILVVDYADRVATVREFIASMDAAAARETGGIPAESYQRLQVSYFHTQYVPVGSVREPILAVLSEAGRVATMPKENRLVVVDYASNIAMVRRVLEKIDRPVPQVRITALIYDISLEDIEELGFNLTVLGTGNDGIFGISSITTDRPPAADNLNDTINSAVLGVVGATENVTISAIARLVQNAKDARLLANPNVTVMDNETAIMNSIQKIPFQQLTQSELGGQLGTTAFEEVGIKLQVTPTVAADGTIRLVVDQEFSRLAGLSASDQPIIDTRQSSSVVRVANRKTLVIGGLRQRSDTGDFVGIPFFKDIKYIGPLFRSRSTTVRESELLVFLMPEIVSYQQSPSQREYLAGQTVNGRLDRVPMAEGGGDPSSCNDCNASLEGEILYEGPVTLPVNETTLPVLIPPPIQTPAPQSKNPAGAPFRLSFGNRYRASGEPDASRRMIQGSTSQPRRSVKDDSRALMRLLHAKR